MKRRNYRVEIICVISAIILSCGIFSIVRDDVVQAEDKVNSEVGSGVVVMEDEKTILGYPESSYIYELED